MSETPVPGTVTLTFDGGTLVLTGGAGPEFLTSLPGVRFDPRTAAYRCEALFYRAIVERLRAEKIPYDDRARQYQPVEWKLVTERKPRDYQTAAVDAWWANGGWGVVVLPTGAGKTFAAMLAVARANRPALIVTPTIDLLNQWHYELSAAFGVEVGSMGGGNHDVRPMTVTTYDSAYIHLDRCGGKFGVLVFDECHHLPGESYQQIARGSIAPFRLGVSATPERSDGREAMYEELVGPIVYRREITEFAGEFLAEYQTRRIYVELSPAEQELYQQSRDTFRNFVQKRGISFSSPSGWQRFLFEATRSPEGWEAFTALRTRKRLEQAAAAKLETLEGLLAEHVRDRTIIFTADNATVYAIARRFLVPPITHQTKSKERKAILAGFHSGEYPTLVTSQVLNEGVDVPAASVGIVLSGTGSTRENVQRLGRLLRKHGDKQAVLYEVVARGTSEEFTSDRRRQHDAFR